MLDTTYRQYVAAIDAAAVDAEIDVLESMAAVYDKQARILMECDMEDLPEYASMFQEGEMQDAIDNANALAKDNESAGILGKSSEPLLVRIALIIPRLIKALFQRIKAFFKSNNSEQRKMEKALTEVKRASEQPVPTKGSASKNQTSSKGSASNKQTSAESAKSESEKESSYKGPVKIKRYRFKDLLLAGGGDLFWTGGDKASKLQRVEADLNDRVPKMIETITKTCEVCKVIADSGQDVTKAQLGKMSEVTENANDELTHFKITVTEPFQRLLRSHMDRHGYTDPFNGRSTYNDKSSEKGKKALAGEYLHAKHSIDPDNKYTGIDSGTSPWILQLPNDITTEKQQKIEANMHLDEITVEEAVKRLEQCAEINKIMVKLFEDLDKNRPDVFLRHRVDAIRHDARGNTRRQSNPFEQKAPKNIDLDDGAVRIAFGRANRFFDKATEICTSAREISVRLSKVFYREQKAIMDAINLYKNSAIGDPHATLSV